MQPDDHARLLRRGFILEWITLGWNVVGVAVLAMTALAARSVALAGLALYLAVQSTLILAVGYHPDPSSGAIGWTAITAAVMFSLAAGKARTGAALHNPVLQTEGRVTLIDGILDAAVLLGLALNAIAGWWWADPLAAYVLVYYASHEARAQGGGRAVER